MKRSRTIFQACLGLVALIVGACGGEPAGKHPSAIAGTYDCQNVERVEVMELRRDGTLKIDGRSEGTWSSRGDSVVFTIDGRDDTLKIEGDRIVGAGDPPPEAPQGFRFVCTPADSNAGTTGSPASSTPVNPPHGASVAGTYNCLQPGSTEPDLIEMLPDGRLRITQGGQTGEGTWTADGNSGAFNPGTPEEERFTIKDGRVVFGDGTTCSRAT